MSEFQTPDALGLLLGARLGESGYLGGVRERAAEGSLLFDEAEKAHPRVLDIFLHSTPRALPWQQARHSTLAASSFGSRQTSDRPN